MRTRTPADVDAALTSRQARRGIAEAHAAHCDYHLDNAIARVHQWVQNGGVLDVHLLLELIGDDLTPAYRHNVQTRDALRGMR